MIAVHASASPSQSVWAQAVQLQGTKIEPLHLRNIASAGSSAAMEQHFVCGQQEMEPWTAAARAAEQFLWLRGANQAFTLWHP